MSQHGWVAGIVIDSTDPRRLARFWATYSATSSWRIRRTGLSLRSRAEVGRVFRAKGSTNMFSMAQTRHRATGFISTSE